MRRRSAFKVAREIVHSERKLLAVLSSLWLLFAMVTPAFASHSYVGQVFWDMNNNGVADASDSLPKWQKAGNSWTTDKTNRITEAMAVWTSQTDYNPSLVTSSINQIYVDGRNPVGCVGDEGFPLEWSEIPGALAANCLSLVGHGSFADINRSWINFNTSNLSYSFVLAFPLSNKWDFRGIATHEIGHGIFLKDLYPWEDPFPTCPPGPTMCGYYDPEFAATQSYNVRTITSDDVSGANIVYP